MRFNKITINNIFSYYGSITYDFSNQSNPIILILGENGFGKTSFINSIKIALHGITKEILNVSESYLSKQEFILGSKDKNFSGLLNRIAKNEDKTQCKIFLEIEDDELFTIERSFNIYSKSYSENLIIYDDNNEKIYENDYAQDFINSKISPTIAKFFFFDGEKIKSISDFSKYEFRKMLEDVLELDIYDTIIEDSDKIIRKIKKQNIDTNSKKILIEKETKLESIKFDIESTYEELEVLNLSLKNMISDENDLTTKLNRLSIKYSKVIEISKLSLLDKKESLKQLQNKFKEIIFYALPLSINESLKVKVKYDIERNYKNKVNISQNIIDIKKKEFLDFIDDENKNNIESIFDKVFMTKENKQSVKFADPIRIENQFSYSLNFDIKKIITQIIEIKKIIELNENELIELEIENEKEQSTYFEDFKKLKDITIEITNKRHILKQLEFKINTLIELEKQIKQDISKISIEDYKNDMANKKIQSLESLKIVTQNIKEKIKLDKREKLEYSVNLKFQLLKKDGYEADYIKIDENYNINVYDINSNIMGILSSSSGQKQVIATALIWGISEYVSDDLPMVMDTPFGRLDESNQSLILKEFCPKVSDQIIILPTSSELKNKHFIELEPYIYKVYSLSNAGSATTIEETLKSELFNKGN